MRRSIWLPITALVVVSFLLACSPAAPTVAPGGASLVPTAGAPTAATAAPVVAATKPAAAAPGGASPTIPAVPAAKIKRGGTLVHASNSNPATMDPIYDMIGTHLKEMAIYEALLRYEVTDFVTGKQEVTPELAESWQQVDPKTITLKLRKGVKFHDGSDFNAEVAKWSLERMGKAPKSLSKRWMANVAAIDVTDPYALKITYKEPSAMQVLDLTPSTGGTGSVGPLILSKAQMDAVGEEVFGASKPSGTGPMKMVEWKRDNEFVVNRFDGYWKDGADGKKLPYLDGIRYRLIPDTAVHLVELRSGTLHLSRALTPSDLPAVRSNPELEVVMIKWAPMRWYYGFFQQKEPFGSNLKLRQAARFATDIDNMAKIFGLDAGTPNRWLGWIPGWPGYDEKIPGQTFDLPKAVSLVKDSGVANPAITLLHYPTQPERRQAEMMQSMWEKAGIKLTLDPMERNAARAKIKAGEFEMHTYNLSPSPDPAYFNRLFTCDGSANWSNFCVKEADTCLLQGQAEIDTAKRADIYKRCLKIIDETALIGGTYNTDMVLVHRKEVKGIRMQNFSEDLHEVWLDK